MKKKTTDFLFEALTLTRLKRTGWQVLAADSEETIASHSYMVCVISYILAKEEKANIEKVLLISLFHDFTESRIGDLYKLSDLYVKADEQKAVNDSFCGLPQQDELVKISKEYEVEKSLESQIVHDADKIALCLELKVLIENGNKNAQVWFDSNIKAMNRQASKKIVKEIQNSNSQDWWKKEREEIHKNLTK